KKLGDQFIGVCRAAPFESFLAKLSLDAFVSIHENVPKTHCSPNPASTELTVVRRLDGVSLRLSNKTIKEHGGNGSETPKKNRPWME
ncbi:hypothetical protein TNCT_159781, partial [Trichonephila clavata]